MQTAKLNVVTPNLLQLTQLSVLRTATNYHIAKRNHRTKRTPNSEQASYVSLHLLGILSMVLESI